MCDINVSREDKKAEAIRRMKHLGLFAPCIKAFEDRDEVQMSEMTGGLYEFSRNDTLKDLIKEFEGEHNALVYNVIHCYTEFGELYNLLYVSDHPDEWGMDNIDIDEGTPFVYVINMTDPQCSEFGCIGVRENFGGLVRIA